MPSASAVARWFAVWWIAAGVPGLTADTTPPEVGGTSLYARAPDYSRGDWVIPVSEPLDGDSVPAKEAFLLRINGVARELSGVRIGYGVLGDAALVLTLIPAPPWPDGTVWRLVYTPPSENPLKDRAGNLMETFDESWGTLPPGGGGGGPPPEPDPEPPPPPPLTADLSVPSALETGLPATFDGSGSVGAESYRWDFGDGTVIAHPSAAAMPSHTYVEPGSYTVRLEVARGECGDEYCRYDEETAAVEVAAGALPAARFDLEAECGTDLCVVRTGVEVAPRDRSSGTVASRRWDFGDGESSGELAPVHSWSTPGFYRVTLTASGLGASSTAGRDILVRASEPAGTCEPDAETLCLVDSRYQVTVEWRTSEDRSGAAKVAYAGTNDSGLFWFFDRKNWEVLVKVLDGCSINGADWVFAASATDLGFDIEVTDTTTGEIRRYTKSPGAPAPAMTDTAAFPDSCRP